MLAALSCGGDDDAMPMADDAAVEQDAGPGMATVTPVFEAPSDMDPRGEMRPWIPVDLDEGTDGNLWVVLRRNRLDEFTDETECTAAAFGNSSVTDDDCFGLEGATAAISSPEMPEMTTRDDARVRFVVDANSWHFMRRPSAIAFGTPELRLEPGDPGTLDRRGQPLIFDTQVFADIFATCPEHATSNTTDEPPFIGPSLWTGSPEIYQTGTLPYSWSNGTHLDMVHATQYCMGIAWERDQVYWVLNGSVGSIDRYDFGLPHSPGHFYHEDATITRHLWPDVEFLRVPDVPMNLEISDGVLYVADTGHARLVTLALNADAPTSGNFQSYEGISGSFVRDEPLVDLVTTEPLIAAWGANPQPSGLAILDENTVVLGDYNSGQLALIDRATGEITRTVDTGLGQGLGGVTVMGGAIYAAHMVDRRVHRIDL